MMDRRVLRVGRVKRQGFYDRGRSLIPFAQAKWHVRLIAHPVLSAHAAPIKVVVLLSGPRGR